MALTAFESRVHHTILSHLVDVGYAPTIDELAMELDETRASTEAALQTLESHHGLVRHPHNGEVWVIHPFATAPTLFWVTSNGPGAGAYWGNCAWCSLGIAALLLGETTISTRLGGHNEEIEIHVRDREVVEDDLLVHFAVPPANAWDNVHYTCDTILVFDSAAAIDEWCEQHGIEKGAVVPIAQVWELAKRWYGCHLDKDWQKWTAAEARAIFEEVGLTGEFWALPSVDETF